MDSPRELAAKLRMAIGTRMTLLDSETADAIAAELERGADAIEALEFYAQQRNYRAAAGVSGCTEHDHRGFCEMNHRDAWDTGLPGARARAALGRVAASAVEGSNQ